jgi:nitroimidazol reductase NimA-like FMN-containing flavoprotein (pyridoxamine 5'-phosphate oxidase superfamily)
VIYRRANRQYVAMSEREVWAFISSKSKVFAAFPMKDGFPHVSPIWFCVFDGKLYLRTHDYKVKAHLARVGKACLSIDEGESYRELKGVILWGRSRLVTDARTIERIERLMKKKYEDQQWKPSEMPEGWVREREKEKRAFIEVSPERVSSWDNSKL